MERGAIKAAAVCGAAALVLLLLALGRTPQGAPPVVSPPEPHLRVPADTELRMTPLAEPKAPDAASPKGEVAPKREEAPPKWDRPRTEERRADRERMVRVQIADQGVADPAVLDAVRNVPRHLFVPEDQRSRAYGDYPLPIGHGQTISQPYIVAFMTQTLALKPGDKVLEIGTGSGYQAAVLSELTPNVFTIEIIKELADPARERLARLGYKTVQVRQGDGYYGWREQAPFDAIIVTAAAGHVPPLLMEQLKPGGRMVIPLGGVYEVQQLVLVTKDEKGNVRNRSLLPVMFVPMTGTAQGGTQERAGR